MKKIILLLAALGLIYANAFTQGCLPQGITFSTQAQIDNFQTNYPGCTGIEGNVTIKGNNITNLNGLSVVTSIGGYLRIRKNHALTSLTGLENLTSIGDYLQIGDYNQGNPSLTSLTGLESLSSIGGYLSIGYNSALTSLTGLESLTNIGGGLGIRSNYALTSLTGLENLSSIGGYLSIYGNSSLTSLTGLENLSSIGGHLYIGSYNALTSLTGLESLTSIGGYLHIRDNNALTSLTGLESLTSIGGSLSISSNNALTSLTALENLTSIGGNLEINNNSSLSTCDAEWLYEYLAAPTGAVNIYNNATGCNTVIDVAYACGGLPCLPFGNYYFNSQADIDNFQAAFPNCAELQGNVTISGYYFPGTDITDLSGLDMVTSIGGYLSIGGNYALNNLTGLENLTSIGGYLDIRGNSALTNLTGLEGITSIGSYLWINNNNYLSSCDAQWLCEYLSAPTGAVNITNNAIGCNSIIELANACGGIPCLPYGNYYFNSQADIDNFQATFPNCTELQGDVSIDGNDITDLSGLDIVTSIGGYLEIGNWFIGGNPALTSLTGLDNLTSIGGYLSIGGNYVLTSLTGLKNVEANTITDLHIIENPSLSTCAVQSICDYLAAPNGTVEIWGNAMGCNSEEEVEAACETVGIEEEVAGSDFSIFPNPFTGQLSIEFNLPQTTMVSIQIFNAMGAKVVELHYGQLPAGQQQFTWYAGHLPKGMYYCRVQAGEETRTQKIIKFQ